MTEATRTPPTDSPDPERTLIERLRGYLPWIGGLALLVAFLGAMKWWGDQQQRAALRGRAWPPVPVRVFLRGY
jgi:hypothetical protein